jgi:heme-degrading monooxygenase HmoA
MVLEVAILNVKPGHESEFEKAFSMAQDLIASIDGYVSHQLQRCIEKTGQYILLVKWKALEDHTITFRGSSQYREWSQLLHHFYEPFPTVEHYNVVYENAL